MADIEKQRKRLIELLKRLFQLDQPDLDFGFYRIMHAKAGQVSKFLEEDLLSIIHEKFGESNENRVKEARAFYEEAVQQAKDYGAPDPEATEAVRKAKSAFISAKDGNSNEGEIYDHLYRFFERYYDNGDFMSLRYFVRETDGRAAPYAVPYDGREVYLHWANCDQYYIKTSEHLTNFTFDPTSAKEFKEHHGELFKDKPLKVHCRIISATEGKYNNIKTTKQTERYFIIHKDEPLKLEVSESGETDLVIQFEFRTDPEKSGQEGTWRKKRLVEANDTINEAFSKLSGVDDFVKALLTPAPTEKEEDRTLLEKYLLQYTARNTMDYFIHKDLGGFLRRELDFYIKNEVMRLDDIDGADALRAEIYLNKIQLLRTIALHLIDFLVQLEEFQKKLWLKKKFVTETDYCMTLDRVPESFYEEIGKNKKQIEEWRNLFSIDALNGYSEPLNTDFLKANPFLVLDTSLFTQNFKDLLLASIQNLDEILDGLLIHSDNEQALRSIRQKYNKKIHCVYIDPPYNTDATPIVYKNNYKRSSWLSLMNSRLECTKEFFCNDNHALCIAIDDTELANLSKLIEMRFHDYDLFKVIVNHYPGSGTGRSNVTRTHEYALFAVPKNEDVLRGEEKIDGIRERNFRRSGTGENNYRTGRENSFYAVLVDPLTLEVVGREKPPALGASYPKEDTQDGLKRIYPIGDDGSERVWTLSYEGFENSHNQGLIKCTKNLVINRLYKDEATRNLLQSVWLDKRYNAVSHGTNLLKNILGSSNLFSYPKSLYTVSNAIEAIIHSEKNPIILDYFAGSGTTGHAIINLNREDEGNRKYILVEMEEYFDTVLKPRIQKVIYSRDWKDGKPVSREGSSHCFKYIRLESYEDVLNNLALNSAPELKSASSDFVKDYMLRYWLDVETKDSPSLLNIKFFDDPTAYTLKVKEPGTDEYTEKTVDLIETFNWLVGLHVEHIDQWRGYDASFKREKDPELPKDTNTRLILKDSLKETNSGAWQLRKIEGYTLRTPGDSSDRERVLVIWRKLTGDTERDNLVLDEWFKKYRLSSQDSEFDIIYVNGSNNLPNLRQEGEKWKVRLIEEAFHQTMWDVEN